MKVFLKINRAAQLHFGKESIIYKIGALTYNIIIKTLIWLGVSPNYFLSNLDITRRITHESSKYKPKENYKHIVFFTVRSWTKHVVFESLIAARLRSEGHRVTFISCADSLPFCMFTSINQPFQIRSCQYCITSKNAIWNDAFDINYLPKPEDIIDSITDDVKRLDLDSCQNFEYEFAPYGQLVKPSIIWFLRRSKLVDKDVDTYQKAIISAHCIRRGLENYFDKTHVDCVVMINGDFSAEKIASWVCRQNNIRYITHDYTINDLLAIGVNNSVWDDLTFDEENRNSPTAISIEEKQKAERILKQWRNQGGYQGNLFWTKKDLFVSNDLRNHLGLDERPLAVAYTNMTFESSVVGKDKVFKDQYHWLKAIIVFFSKHDEFQLVIRIHPAEVRQSDWRPNESLYDFLIKTYPSLPNNIKTIGPSEKVSSYQLGVVSNIALVYSSTIALELADRRKRVITAAHVHYARRGFTTDPKSEDEYFYELRKYLNVYSELSEPERQYLVNYVAWLFLKRLISFEPITSYEETWPNLNIGSLTELRNPGLKGVERIIHLIAEGERWW